MTFSIRQVFRLASDDEVLPRMMFAHAMLPRRHGAATIHPGGKHRLAGDGNDRDARGTMFARQTSLHPAARPVGAAKTNGKTGAAR